VFSSPTSRWAGGVAAVCLGLVAVTYVGLVGPRRSEADDLTASAASTQAHNDALQMQIEQLKAQFAKLPQKEAELASVFAQLPVAADVPTVVRSLDALAASSGVSLDAVTPAAAQNIDAKGHPATVLGTSSGASSGAGSSQIVGVPMTVTVHGPYFKTVTFLKGLQSGERAFLVTGLQVTVAQSDVTLTIRGRVFALPGAAATIAALAAGSTTASAGASPSAAASPAPAVSPSPGQ
jgi:hypothetical protein